MDDQTKKYLMYGGAAIAAGFLIYQVLERTGVWGQWFGSGHTQVFTDRDQLIAWCQQNPNGVAAFSDGGNSETYSAADWLRFSTQAPIPGLRGPFNPSGTFNFQMTARGVAVPVPTVPISAIPITVGDKVTADLREAALANPVMRGDQGTASQWNMLLAHVDPQAVRGDLSAAGVGLNDSMDAAAFMRNRAAAGLDSLRGLGSGVPVEPETMPEPYEWVN